MPLKCRMILVKRKRVRYDKGDGKHGYYHSIVNTVGEKPPVPGDMFYRPDILEKHPQELAPHYFAHNSWRDPICVVLPNGTWFLVDSKTTTGPDGWVVTGEPPNITVQPSINVVGLWHGYLTSGELSDDVEGRRF